MEQSVQAVVKAARTSLQHRTRHLDGALQIITAEKVALMSTKPMLRQRINKDFALDEDLDELLIDYFDDVWKSISRGMSRKDKVNQLFSSKDESEIEQALNTARPEKVTSQTSPGGVGPSQEESVKLRQEIARLHHVMKDLEQEARTKDSKPSISAPNGLQRIQRNIQDFDILNDNPQNLVEHQWLAFSHSALDALESALGEFHNIASDFRFRSTIERQPISLDYRALLCAAETILKQRIEESDRAHESWKQLQAEAHRETSIW